MLNKHYLKYGLFTLATCLFVLGCYKETAITIEGTFDVTYIKDNTSVPVQVSINNKIENADTFEWTFSGGTPSQSFDKNPGTITYTKASTYIIQLKASNVDGQEAVFQKEITLVDGIDIQFSTEILYNNFPPVEVKINNTVQGKGFTYSWIFEGGTPETSNAQHPSNIIFSTIGEHKIILKVFNGTETFTKETSINVAPDMVLDFNWDVAFQDDDYQVPVTIHLKNISESATNYNWTFQGGLPNTSSEKEPTITFNTPGNYTLTLVGNNGKKSQTVSKSITVHPNTNLRSFTDVKLGINTAHSNNFIGAFFSTTTGQVYKKQDVKEANGHLIDIPYFGFNKNFNVNKFVSPTQVQTLTFNAIPNATNTIFIHSQESCNCSASLTKEQFDAMLDDTLLNALTIEETTGGLKEFDNTLIPRIVLFKTNDNRKGAIKIKSYVNDEANSYIVCDIKVQKQ
ncbi:PKD domain-containing protein [Mariniflexile ostreae]|uniref:PKD domain-containing protein n=1 Tax=Mariniflexile ostreae TaxID=1520892 RepID=A0ABV5FB11_9FLAO